MDVALGSSSCSSRGWSSLLDGPVLAHRRPYVAHNFGLKRNAGLSTELRQHLRQRAASDDDYQTINLDMAASAYAKAADSGVDVDEIVAQQLGVQDPAKLTDTQKAYKDKIKAKLEERAEELRREKEARQIKFTKGKAAYARGQYEASVVFLESALNEEGPFSQLGGEIQMWLALAYQACGREEDCIETYKIIEKTHPVPSIRRQAAELRYIMEAPKLELGEDEKVKIPVLTDLDPNRGGRAPVSRPRPVKREKPKTWDEEFWENYQPPQYLKNRYVWAAAAIVTLGLAWYSANMPK